MSILFAGGEPGDFVTTSPLVVSGSGFDSTYARASVVIAGSADKAIANFAATPELWVKFNAQIVTSSTSNGTAAVLLTSSGENVFRIAGTGASLTLRFERWDGAAWVVVGSSFTYAANVRNTYLLRVKTGTSGLIEVRINDGVFASWTGDTSGLGNIDQVTLSVANSSGTFYYSEVMVASHDLTSARLKTLAITGAGAINEWVGSFADVDSSFDPDEAFVASGTALQKVLFAKAGLANDSLKVDALVISGRFRRNSSGPANIDAIVRVGSTDYNKPLGTLMEAFAHKQVIFAVDPATSAPWTRAAITSAQYGLQSKA